MKLTTKARYGVSAMYDLARSYGEGPQPLKAIARRQDAPEPYLEQLMGALKRAGLIETVRGAQGGYLLARAPEAIAVGDIIRALEGEGVPQCVLDTPSCEHSDDCVMHVLYERVHDGVTRALDGLSLSDLLKDTARAHACCEK